jgi:hypothetical protein
MQAVLSWPTHNAHTKSLSLKGHHLFRLTDQQGQNGFGKASDRAKAKDPS